MRITVVKRATIYLAAVTILSASSPVDPVNKDPKGVTLKGYDPVAYFTEGKAVKGSEQFAYEWSGAIWWFANQADRENFVARPEAYAPQFGGYCSWAVGHNYTADTDPEAWKIVDGKLYVNYSKSIQKKWEQDIRGFIQAADRNWPALHK